MTDTITRAQADAIGTTAGFAVRPDATALLWTIGGVRRTNGVWTDVVGDPANHASPFVTIYRIAG